MKVQVLFFARLKEIFGESSRWMSLREGASIHELVGLLRHESEELGLDQVPLVYAVNEDFTEGERILRDQDTLALMTPMAGG